MRLTPEMQADRTIPEQKIAERSFRGAKWQYVSSQFHANILLRPVNSARLSQQLTLMNLRHWAYTKSQATTNCSAESPRPWELITLSPNTLGRDTNCLACCTQFGRVSSRSGQGFHEPNTKQATVHGMSTNTYKRPWLRITTIAPTGWFKRRSCYTMCFWFVSKSETGVSGVGLLNLELKVKNASLEKVLEQVWVSVAKDETSASEMEVSNRELKAENVRFRKALEQVGACERQLW